MKKIFPLLLALVMVFTWTVAAQATLISRLGGLAFYDDDLMITWLADANAGAGSTFDDGFSTTDGRMTWQNANDWAASLTVGGFTNWRLPTTTQPDSTCGSQLGTLPQRFGFGCTGSEMGHLFNIEGITFAAPGPFTNIQADLYWSATEFAPNPAAAWDFLFSNGFQGLTLKGLKGGSIAWAVRPGDVAAPVPEPSMLLLLGSGLVGLGGFGWRNRRLRR